MPLQPGCPGVLDEPFGLGKGLTFPGLLPPVLLDPADTIVQVFQITLVPGMPIEGGDIKLDSNKQQDCQCDCRFLGARFINSRSPC